MPASWVFPEIKPFQVQGRGTAEDNFTPEDRENLEIMMREVLQNPLDARVPESDVPVRVSIRIYKDDEFNSAYLSKIIGPDFLSRLAASGAEPLSTLIKPSVLVIEDFGTTGLEGNWYDQNADGQTENWNAFWFREGEGAKLGPSNGRAGQGKITYYRAGASRAIFGLTIRKSDNAALLMGRSAFKRSYLFDEKKYQMQSFWCADKEHPLPITDETEIKNFKDAFNLSRTSEPGLSIVIPFPLEFDPKVLLQTVISEFYYPIARGRLEIEINDSSVNVGNLDKVADDIFDDSFAQSKRSSFTKGFRAFVQKIIAEEKSGAVPIMLNKDWDKATTIPESSFPGESLIEFRKAIENGKRVWVRCPITVRPRRAPPIDTYFDVHLEVPENLEHAEEAYIRRDLLIGSENHLANSTYLQKARGFTVISSAELSAFLADAEEPTHLKWNASRSRLAEDYLNPNAQIRAVRQAAPRLLASISNGILVRDTKALARYFARRSGDGVRKGPAGTPRGDKETNPPVDAPLPVRKPLKIETFKDGVKVIPNGTSGPVALDLPMTCKLELAYEGLDQDPFKFYDPFDFDLKDLGTYKVLQAGISVLERKENRIVFDILDPNFFIRVEGFDSNIRLKARLNFSEKHDGTSDSDE